MARTTGRDNRLERELRSALFKRGWRFRKHFRPLEGFRRTVDVAFPKLKVAVFVDGCFWHGCPQHGTWPKRNAVFWRDKIRANIQRDKDTNRKLRAQGWKVVRIWTHHTLEEALGLIEQALER
jgi:DNA mismatch endonuclease (patch repair protein)